MSSDEPMNSVAGPSSRNNGTAPATVMSASGDSQTTIARKTWEMLNNVESVGSVDEIYRYDKKQQQDILTTKPWERDPHFFKDIKISALALLKMVMHARSGGTLEVMGLLLGKVDGNTMLVMDSFALPVEGTETRVNAQAQAYEYMTAYIEAAKLVGRLENAIGWYHSHPGCWLSGIDVSTQMLNQNYQEPFVAIVIDPTRTISAGKVCIGAFRTYPKGYKPPSDEPSEYQTIPLNKIEDFGVHCKSYYPLDITYFKSALDRRLLDSLWNKYWVNTLSSTSLLTNADYTTGQIFDLSEKLEQSENSLGRSSLMLGTGMDPHEKKGEDKLSKATKDSCKTTIEVIHGLMTQSTMESKNEGTTHEIINGWNYGVDLSLVKERFPRMPESDLLKARNLVMALLNLTENSILELESASPTEGSLSSAVQASVVNPNPLELERLLDKVLSYLPVNSLLNARLVNHTWNSFAVDWIRNKRKSYVAVQYAEFPRLCSDFEKCEVLPLPFSNLEVKSPGPGENLEKVLPFFLQHGRFVEGLKLNNTSLNLDGRKALGTIFKCVPNLKKLLIVGINPDDGYGPGIPFYESDQSIQLRQVKDLEFFVSNIPDTPLHKVFLDQVFALIPNLKNVNLTLLAPSQDFELVAEAMKHLHLAVLHDPFRRRLSYSAQFWKLIAGSQKLKELTALELRSRPSHDLVVVEAQEELLRSQSESLEILRLLNQRTPANNRAILEFPVMKNLRRLELYFFISEIGLNPLMVPLQPNQVPRLRSLEIGPFLEAVSIQVLAPSPFTSVEEVELFVREVSSSVILPEMVSRFPNLKKLTGLTILEAQDMALLVSCFPDIEELELYVFNIPGHERPSGDFSDFFSGISLDLKLALSELAGRVGIDSVLSWIEIETPRPSLRDLKRLRKLKIVFTDKYSPERMFVIDELGVHLTLLHFSPTLHLTLHGDVSISTKLASKVRDHFQNFYFRQREESDDLPGGDVYFRPVQMKSE